jgi:hypothetical protein
MEYKRAVNEFYFYLRQPGTNFHHQLFELIMKADPENAERIRAGFPNEVRVVEDWRKAPTESEFFRSKGLPYGLS